MSTIKKLLALTLALAMVLSVSAFAGFSGSSYKDAASINGDCEDAIELLYALDIMTGDDKGNFNPEATITRAEVAKMIYVILNYGDDDKAVNYTGANIFSDVVKGAWYEGYVNYMAMTKLVQGRPDGTFGPNDPITTAEAAKMLLTAIGYSSEARGYTGAGWDKNVLSDAAIIGLLDGYKASTTTFAPRQWVAVMFKNALTGALTYGTIAPVVFNGLLTGINYDYDYDTMGWKYFGLYSWEGIIVANEYADLRDEKALDTAETIIDGEDNQYFDNWTTDLTEIGEYRWGYAVAGDRDISDADAEDVVYVGGEEENTEFSTGAGTIIKKSKIDGIKLNASTEYFMNFDPTQDVYENYETGNGDWLRVVDNDDDGYAEYVFVTEFEMTEVTGVHKNGTVTLANKAESMDFVMSEDVAEDDIVLYTKIDGNEYVEIAETVVGEADKYTYKTRVLTVEGEDYPQSDIEYATIANAFYGNLEDALKDTEYTYYLDFFGNIRVFSEDVVDAGDLVLLTDAYYETNRNGKVAAVDAYLDGEIADTDVKTSTTSTDIADFIDMRINNSNAWGRLIEYTGDAAAWTNVARYTMSDEGVMSLFTAKTHNYNNLGNATTVKTDYVDLVEEDLYAGQATYNAEGGVKVQANKNTVYYYVDEDLNIKTVVGYKNTVDVVGSIVGINAMYAVATNVSSDASSAKYWVADVIVIETEVPAFNLNDDVVLGYNVVNKTVNDYAELDIVDSTAALDDLYVVSLNGDDFDKFEYRYIDAPAFYFNTEDEDGESYIIEITEDFAAYDIYVGTVDRANKLYEYVVAIGGQELSYTEESVVVYDIDQYARYNSITDVDDYDDALELETGSTYIFFAPDEEIVYAVLVDADTKALADAIIADAQPVVTVENNLYSVKVLGEEIEADEADPFTYTAYVCSDKTEGEAPRLEVVDNYVGAKMELWNKDKTAKIGEETGVGSIADQGTAVSAVTEWVVISDGIEYTVKVVILSADAGLTELVEGVEVAEGKVVVYSTYANETNFVPAAAVKAAEGASFVYDAEAKTITVTAVCGCETVYTVEFAEYDAAQA